MYCELIKESDSMAEHGRLDSLTRTPCAKVTRTNGCQGLLVRKNLRSVKFCRGRCDDSPRAGPRRLEAIDHRGDELGLQGVGERDEQQLVIGHRGGGDGHVRIHAHFPEIAEGVGHVELPPLMTAVA